MAGTKGSLSPRKKIDPLRDRNSPPRFQVLATGLHTPTPSTSATVLKTRSIILSSSNDDECDEPLIASSVEEVKSYSKEKRIKGTNEDTFKWWSQNRRDYPNLVKVVHTYLCCPPSSVPSGQLFSGAGLNYVEKRKRLHADKIEKLLFLKSNLPLLKFKY